MNRNIRFEERVLEALIQEAKKQDRSVNYIVNKIIKDELRIPPQDTDSKKPILKPSKKVKNKSTTNTPKPSVKLPDKLPKDFKEGIDDVFYINQFGLKKRYPR